MTDDARVVNPDRGDKDLDELRLECDDHGRLTLALGKGAVHKEVRVRRAAPLSDPDRYIVFLDEEGREICVVRDPRRLSQETQAVLRSALDCQYLSSQVLALLSLRIESEVCYFEAETSRGHREFIIPNLQEGVRRLGDRKVLFVDVDGNRFEINDLEMLDRRSLALLKRVL